MHIGHRCCSSAACCDMRHMCYVPTLEPEAGDPRLQLVDEPLVLPALPGGVNPVVLAGGQSGREGCLRVTKTARDSQQGGDLVLQYTGNTSDHNTRDEHVRHVGRAIHITNQARGGCVDGLCGVSVCVCVP